MRARCSIASPVVLLPSRSPTRSALFTTSQDPKKARFPAYCDRIQWCSNDSNFEQLYYRRAGRLKASDHKPVMALFDVPIKSPPLPHTSTPPTFSPPQTSPTSLPSPLWPHAGRTSLPRRSICGVDWRCWLPTPPPVSLRSPSTATPSTSATSRFEVPVLRRLIVKNTGNSVVVFRCESAVKGKRPKAEGAVNLLLPWLNVDPLEGVIHPNSAVELTLTIFVDRYCAYLLNTEEESITTPIVLRMTSRHAAEIALKGRYMKSCLGSDLAFLLALTHPIRAPQGLNDGRQVGKDARPAVPYEVFRLVDHIIKAGGTTTKGNFYPPALVPLEEGPARTGYTQIESTPQVRYLCEQLDTGRAFDQPATEKTPAIKLPTHFFVQALLYFLHSLRKPLFFKRGKSLTSPSPVSHHKANGSVSSSSSASAAAGGAAAPQFNLTTWCYQTLMDLPSENYRTFTFVLRLPARSSQGQSSLPALPTHPLSPPPFPTANLFPSVCLRSTRTNTARERRSWRAAWRVLSCTACPRTLSVTKSASQPVELMLCVHVSSTSPVFTPPICCPLFAPGDAHTYPDHDPLPLQRGVHQVTCTLAG